MSTPTREQLSIALETAAKMREQGEDPHFMAKSLLSLNYRFTELEHVYEALEHFLNSGQAAEAHSALIKAVEHFREVELRSKGEGQPAKFGL
ncbi:hypothetical protein [Litoribrevibacter albus]|uniref:Uncharacterized protein n=1 Tax=Litoribrevibacter albus TaxID=1473156 RepID=A0AA37W814_9GAMM|nr:hypothetical protein [Litoribrevibacter albus]GLQ32008.1 hypothetical protein GCM10007876_24870 [Litoribrevibacter albus]